MALCSITRDGLTSRNTCVVHSTVGLYTGSTPSLASPGSNSAPEVPRVQGQELQEGWRHLVQLELKESI